MSRASSWWTRGYYRYMALDLAWEAEPILNGGRRAYRSTDLTLLLDPCHDAVWALVSRATGGEDCAGDPPSRLVLDNGTYESVEIVLNLLNNPLARRRRQRENYAKHRDGLRAAARRYYRQGGKERARDYYWKGGGKELRQARYIRNRDRG